MFVDAAKNLMLDALPTANALDLSLHSAFSLTGANELAGGAPAYARKPGTYAAAAGGSKALSTQPAFDVPAGATVRWVGRWKGATFLGMAPNGAAPKEFAVEVVANKIRSVAHGLVDGQTIVFYGGAVPGGLAEGTIYFVRAATADDFEVAATSGGVAIDLTSQAAAACVVSRIVEETYGSQGTLTVTADTLALNF